LADDSTYTLQLSLNGWKSKPVTVQTLRGRVIPDSVVFEMQAENIEQPQGRPSADQPR
jgi:hypothetical protein